MQGPSCPPSSLAQLHCGPATSAVSATPGSSATPSIMPQSWRATQSMPSAVSPELWQAHPIQQGPSPQDDLGSNNLGLQHPYLRRSFTIGPVQQPFHDQSISVRPRSSAWTAGNGKSSTSYAMPTPQTESSNPNSFVHAEFPSKSRLSNGSRETMLQSPDNARTAYYAESHSSKHILANGQFALPTNRPSTAPASHFTGHLSQVMPPRRDLPFDENKRATSSRAGLNENINSSRPSSSTVANSYSSRPSSSAMDPPPLPIPKYTDDSTKNNMLGNSARRQFDCAPSNRRSPTSIQKGSTPLADSQSTPYSLQNKLPAHQSGIEGFITPAEHPPTTTQASIPKQPLGAMNASAENARQVVLSSTNLTNQAYDSTNGESSNTKFLTTAEEWHGTASPCKPTKPGTALWDNHHAPLTTLVLGPGQQDPKILRNYAAQSSHDRQMAIEDLICQYIKDDDFVTLCQDVENSCTKIGLNY